MTFFEKIIVDSFFQHYLNSAAAPGKRMTISAAKLYPDFEAAPPDKKEAFLEAAESLAERGVLKLTWYKRRKREALRIVECIDKDALLRMMDKPFPKTVLENIKESIPLIISYAKAPCCKKLLVYMAENVTLKEVEHGIDRQVFKDFAKLLNILYESDLKTEHSAPPPDMTAPYMVLDGITPRALSVMLFSDPKRIETITKLFSRLLKRAEKQGHYVPNLSFLARCFPETLISGKIEIHFNRSKTPLTNDTGNIIGLPLETVKDIKRISAINRGEKKVMPTVLTVENKETFYALKNSKKYSCLLYTGGYPSRAVSTLMRVLSDSGFDFFHAGDVDPDGILILQTLCKNARKNITPVCMDAATFHKYCQHGRKLEQSMLDNIRLIDDAVRSIDGIQEVLLLIENTGIGIEQELIDYGFS
jgi:hypothetical protein